MPGTLSGPGEGGPAHRAAQEEGPARSAGKPAGPDGCNVANGFLFAQ